MRLLWWHVCIWHTVCCEVVMVTCLYLAHCLLWGCYGDMSVFGTLSAVRLLWWHVCIWHTVCCEVVMVTSLYLAHRGQTTVIQPSTLCMRDDSTARHGKSYLVSNWILTSCQPHKLYITLRASLSGTFLQTLLDLVTPLKGHSLSPRSCPLIRSAPSERFGS